GVMKVASVDPLSSFNTTRSSLQQPIGNDGDEGIDRINGYTTSFTEGISGWCDLYKVTLVVIGTGSANVTVWPAAEAKFAASTPEGVKVGHTDNHGNPAASVYPAALPFEAVAIPGDITGNGCVDLADYARISAAWLSEPGDGNWDAACDISPPADLIDTADLCLLAENLTQGCGP
ncbi:MAG: hypothetical protein ACO20W_10985, partial [Anaerohalosphaeraceae bacterium]